MTDLLTLLIQDGTSWEIFLSWKNFAGKFVWGIYETRKWMRCGVIFNEYFGVVCDFLKDSQFCESSAGKNSQ